MIHLLDGRHGALCKRILSRDLSSIDARAGAAFNAAILQGAACPDTPSTARWDGWSPSAALTYRLPSPPVTRTRRHVRSSSRLTRQAGKGQWDRLHDKPRALT